ncbi:MAG: xanthine dehydrogenase family protein molybdopterin-binding subunit [Chloroflexi bacterium]|nr:xanthine dehydrogenase family protein molybdopterin-binding subunit [Chloroflexota bacterium]MCI0866970.1 xanthine dehydrogenase family protein molybdopterin-binding subunit [Chloroflexota bacterium]MCI0895594.1 xanthine dehydrogenase family protein molybdopterin-binding subunit [Chloroflexota bacterium]
MITAVNKRSDARGLTSSAIGRRPIRQDGMDKVTGKALYGADIRLPGMLWGKVLRSPHPHARILSIDTSKAEAHDGVKAVVTSKDLAPLPVESAKHADSGVLNLKFLHDNILAGEKVLYMGHPVAAVAATSAHVAEEALRLIDVAYEPLPAVTNVEDAMRPGAPILHDTLPGSGLDIEVGRGTNVARHQRFTLGDVESGLREADVVIEREYRTATVHQGYIEPHNATAWWSPDSRVTIWCSTQAPFEVRDTTAQLLGIPPGSVRVVPLEVGGGFGGKLTSYLEPLAALLAKKSGSPVKMAMGYSEVLAATGPTGGSYVRVKLGATRDGQITAAQAYVALEAGAYPGAFITGAMGSMFTPYDIPNLLIDGYDVVTNKPKAGAYRAPGAPIGAFAVESLLDEMSQELAIDPVEFRLLNAAREGTRRADGIRNPPIGIIDLLEAVKAHAHYQAPLDGENRGRGLAIGFWRNNTGQSSVVANVNPDGTLSLVMGSVDLSGSRVAVAQQLAEALGIPVEDVQPQVVDTDTVGYTSSTSGSGMTFKTGWAAYEAGQDIKRQLIERAAWTWQVPACLVEYCDGAVNRKQMPEQRTTFKELAARMNITGGPVVGRGNVYPKGVGGSCTATLVDVEVDPETGKVQVLRCTAFQDAGRAIHPGNVEGQIQGGTAQGIGWALHEGYYMSDDGRMLNTSLLDYRIPTCLDLPMIDAVIVEVPNPGHPYGVRGVGEAPIVPPLAAVANAVSHAVGRRMTQLPMSPAAVLEALWEEKPSCYLPE